MDTIFVLNTNRQVIDVLSNNGSNPSAPFFGDTYTSELDTGAESYEFTTINNARTNVTLEVGNYVLFKYNGKYKLFQIMETTDEHSEGKKLLTVYAEMAGMELRNDYCEPFTLEGNFINLLERVLQDTNWRVGTYSESLLYNIQSISYNEPKNVYSIIQENLATFGGVEIEFRVEFIGNQLAALLIDCYESGTRGNKKYRRFEYGKDVKGITRERNINDLATAVIGQGNNNLTFKDVEWSKNLGNPCDKPLQQNFVVDIDANDLWNNGGKYIKTVHKVDTDDAQTLLQECWDYLQEIKQPKFDYDVDLALVAEDYQDIGVGDTNYVLDFDYQPAILLEARVGKLELSFADPRDNKCTLTNYKELVSILQQPVDLNTVGNMIQSHFPIEGEDIAMGAIGEGHINVTYYQAIKTDIMSATLAEVGTLIADKADITDLTAINAEIENLRATKAEIEDLNATNGNITNLTSQVGQIETVINNHFTGTDAQILNITAQNTTFDNAVIKNAMIDTVSGNKVNTGTLNTNNVNIESEDGGIKISGATQQFKDNTGTVRVQIGKDAQGNFTFCLFSQDGTGILLDETGIKAGAVPDGLIVNNMVADNANISGNKLDISSVITSINNNTTSINSSSIKFDDTGQSLLVAFNSLKNKVETIENITIDGDLSSVMEQVQTNTTNIGVMQGQISSLISNTTITKSDGTVVQLKDEYNNTVSTVNSNTTKIGTLESNYNKVSGDLESVTSKQSTLEQSLDEVSSTLTATATTANAAKTQASTNKQTIDSMSTTLTSTTKTANEAKTQASTNKQTIDSMSTTLTSTTNTANNALTKATAAQQNLDGFKTTVSDTYATKSALSEVKQTADGVSATVSNIRFGGKNLLLRTDFNDAVANDISSLTEWKSWGPITVSSNYTPGDPTGQVILKFNTANVSGGIYQDISLRRLPKGTQCVISYTLDKQSNVGDTYITVEYREAYDSGADIKKGVETFKGTYGYQSHVFTTPTDIDYNYVRVVLNSNGITSTDSNYRITLKYLMLEMGNIASSWKESSYDLASKSEVKLTTDALEVRIDNSSQANLLPHSGISSSNTAGWYLQNNSGSNVQWYYSDVRYIGIKNTGSEEGCAWSPTFNIGGAGWYSLSGWIKVQSNVKGSDVYFIGTKDVNIWNYDFIHHCTSIDGGDNEWHKFEATFEIPGNVFNFAIRVDHNGLVDTNSGSYVVVYFGEFMLTRGKNNYPPYTDSLEQMHTGVTKIDNQGLIVTMNDGDGSSGSTRVSNDGLTIYDGSGNKKAWFGDNDTAFIDKISTNKIEEPSIIRWNKDRPLNLYCAPNATGDGSGRDANNRASSIGNALNWLWTKYGCYNWRSEITIYLAGGDYWGADNYIGGWIGSGMIRVVFDEWACLRTPLRIEECTLPVYIQGGVNAWNWSTQNNAYMYMNATNAIEVRNATVVIGGLNIKKEGWGGNIGTWNNYQANCIEASEGARVYMTCCDITGFQNLYACYDACLVSIVNCRGHVYSKGVCNHGSIRVNSECLPLFNDGTYYYNGGQGLGSETRTENSWFDTKPEAPYTPPVVTENWQWTEQTFWATSLWTTPEGSGSGTTARSGCWGQGSWSSYKSHRGYASFDGINSWCNGGRNFTAYLTMTRLNTNHGYAGAVPVPKLKQRDGNFWSCGQAFARGDTKTIQLPWEVASWLIEGASNNLEMWAGSSHNDYSFYDNVSIRITCEKNFV